MNASECLPNDWAVQSLDHLVLTVAVIEATCDFYERALGMRRITFGPQSRVALTFGTQKINLHVAGHEFDPKASAPTPGSADLCFIVASIDRVLAHLAAERVPVIEGPVSRTGAMGQIRSIYLRDPDGNLIELSEYL
ncbi:MAG: VOC family protein [Hyphomicrobiaceae bacterium]